MLWLIVLSWIHLNANNTLEDTDHDTKLYGLLLIYSTVCEALHDNNMWTDDEFRWHLKIENTPGVL